MKYIILLLFASLAFRCVAQDRHPLVQAFYDDAAARGVTLPDVKIRVYVSELREAVNGKISKLPDGSYAITIEQEFHNYYGGESQEQRLVYFLLAHELLQHNVYKRGLMRSEHVYYRLRTKLVDKLFDNYKNSLKVAVNVQIANTYGT